MLRSVIIPNVIAMILLAVLLFSAKSVSGGRRMMDSKIFEIMVAINFFQCGMEILAYSIEGIQAPGFHFLNILVNAILFAVNICFAYLWVVYAEYKIFEDMDRVKARAGILALPAVLIVCLSLLNLFTPVFFRVSSDNHYQRTSLFFLPYLLTYFYLSYGTFFIYRHKSQARRYVFLPAIIFMFPILIGSIVQFFFYGCSTVWVGVSIALMAVYVNMQNETSYIDALSGLYTRPYMTQFLEHCLKEKDRSVKFMGILIDIDDFKEINDTYGHLIGDDAIRSTGKILRQCMNETGIAARYGGDEFVLLMPIRNDENTEVQTAALKQAEEQFNSTGGKLYQLHFSLGVSLLDLDQDTVDTFLERMDTAMYHAKKERKH